jgi:hypothetical protein
LLYRLGSGLTQNPFFLPTTPYLAFLGSPPLVVGCDMLSSITCGSPLNIHHGGHHAKILTILHSRVLFLTSLSPNRRRWRSSEKARRSRTQTLINSIYADYLPNKVPAGCSLDEEDAGLMLLLANCPTSAMAGRPPTSINV